MKVVLTGASGLLGRHAAIRLHARNCAARSRGEREPFAPVLLGRADFGDPSRLREAVAGAGAVLHFAGVARGAESTVESGNPAIAEALAQACRESGSAPHIVYANSIYAAADTPYGRGKRRAGDILARASGRFTDLVLPHLFGEGGRPRYNNVTATFVEAILAGGTAEVDPKGAVRLLHAGAAAEAAIDALADGASSRLEPEGQALDVPELWRRLGDFHARYEAGLFPDLRDPFDLTLFNTYRAAIPPDRFPRMLKRSRDARGTLFEAVKGGGGGQTFLSWTEPGATRGDHFHLAKVERFLVLEGEAVIRMRPVLGTAIHEYRVGGAEPAAVDIPTLHAHSIENVGERPLLTLFWAHEIFDPAVPDTYRDPVPVS